MGACLGLFKKKSRKRQYKLQRCIYLHEEDKIELELLVDGDIDEMTENEDLPDVWTMSGKLPPNFAKVGRVKRKNEKTIITKSQQCLLDNLRNEDLEGTQLFPLDAHSLLATRALQKRKISCSSSTPPSSIDLEWENEVSLGPNFKTKSQPTSHVEDGSSCSGCGETSPPESLEWDPCDPTATDFETEQLINEIEQLTNRALQETGDWTNR